MSVKGYAWSSTALLFAHILLATHASAQRAVVALVDGRPVLESELDSLVGDKLLRLRTEEHALRMVVLNEHLDLLLLSREADKRGTSPSELLKKEVDERVAPVTEREAQAVLDSVTKTNDQLTEGLALRGVMEDIKRRRMAKLRSELLVSLRQRYPTKITLEPPRLTQTVGGGQRRGAANAPVSILVFSDFQCPYCTDLDASLRRIVNEYGTQVQMIAKQFPLPAHRQAASAAEAALCAADQRRYWEMHETLFSTQNLVAQGQFSELARRAGLDIQQFEGCMNAHKFFGEVAHDIVDARAVGVNSTPTTFINGLMVVGAKPYEILKETINTEILRAKTASKSVSAK
jgi:predicted DsbA family dithiol-disulfide isomerase